MSQINVAFQFEFSFLENECVFLSKYSLLLFLKGKVVVTPLFTLTYFIITESTCSC